jgi:hypothetical protein
VLAVPADDERQEALPPLPAAEVRTPQRRGLMKPHHSCTVVRRVLVSTGHVNLATGKTEMTGEHWETGPCGIPLFSEEESRSGICRSCASGWTHPHNYPLDVGPPTAIHSEPEEA